MKNFELLIELYKNSGEKIVIANQNLIAMWKSHDYLPDVISQNDLGMNRDEPVTLPIKKLHVFKFTDSYTVKLFPIIEQDETTGYILTFLDSEDIEKIYSKSILNQYRRRMLGNERMALMPIINEASEYYYKGQDIPKEFFLNAKKNVTKLLSHNVNQSQISRYYSNEIILKLTSITQTLEEVVTRFKNELELEDINFTYDIEHGLFCKMDSSCLAVTVLNLLVNGYMYNNSMEKNILLKVYTENGNLIIDVWDNGTSADVEKLERYKKPFNNIELSSKGESLGLSLVNKFAEYFNGDLTFIKDDNGLTVRVSLPYRHEDPTCFKSRPAIFPSGIYFDAISCVIAKVDKT